MPNHKMYNWRDSQDDINGIASIFNDEQDDILSDMIDGDRTSRDVTPTDVLGELSLEDEMSDPESDDYMVNYHEDYDNPRPLNTAADIAEAEKSRRGS